MPLEPTPFNELVDEFLLRAPLPLNGVGSYSFDFSKVSSVLRRGWNYVNLAENSDKVYFCDLILAKHGSQDFFFVITRWGRRGRNLSYKIVKLDTKEEALAVADKISKDRYKHEYQIQFEIRGSDESVAREKVPDESVPLIPDYEEI